MGTHATIFFQEKGSCEGVATAVLNQRMSGEVDYLVKVIVPDIGGYDRFYRRLIRAVKLTDA